MLVNYILLRFEIDKKKRTSIFDYNIQKEMKNSMGLISNFSNYHIDYDKLH